MARALEHIRAEKLRKRGWSINKIAEQLQVSKSTTSKWCRDILLTEAQKDRLLQNSIAGGHKGRILGSETNKKRKLEIIAKYNSEGQKSFKHLSKRDLLVAGVCLYWAEGAKTGGRIIFVNSDPDMILLSRRFIREVLEVSNDDIRVTIQINRIHEKRINKVTRFWSKLLKIPLDQFNNPYYINVTPKKVYSNYNQYYGLARLRVLKSANLQYKVLGLINALKEHKLPT